MTSHNDIIVNARIPKSRKGDSIRQHLIDTRNSLFGNSLAEGVNPDSWLKFSRDTRR